MYALSDAREFSFSQVPYVEREEKTTDQSNVVNDDVMCFYATFSGGNLRELKQQRWRQQQKRHWKVYSRCFKLDRAYSTSFSSSKDGMKVQEKKKKFAALCFRPPQKGLSCRSRVVMAKKFTKKRDARARLLLNLLPF